MRNQQELDFEEARKQILQWADREDIAKHKPVIRRFAHGVGRRILCMLGGSLVVAALIGLMGRLM